MRKTIYAFGIATFLAMFIFTIATSLTNPFYGMSEAALAQTSSTCTSGGGGSTTSCPTGCQHSCNSYTTLEIGDLPPGDYTGWIRSVNYEVCCTVIICQNGYEVPFTYENMYESCIPNGEVTSNCTKCADWWYY